MVLYISSSSYSTTVISITFPIVGIAFSLIIIRVGNGTSVTSAVQETDRLDAFVTASRPISGIRRTRQTSDINTVGNDGDIWALTDELKGKEGSSLRATSALSSKV